MFSFGFKDIKNYCGHKEWDATDQSKQQENSNSQNSKSQKNSRKAEKPTEY
jgi:hypothetical protein